MWFVDCSCMTFQSSLLFMCLLENGSRWCPLDLLVPPPSLYCLTKAFLFNITRFMSVLSQWHSEGRAWPGTCPAKSTMFVPFMSCNLVRSVHERLAYSQVPAQYE